MSKCFRYFRARHVATMTRIGVIDDGCVVANELGRVDAVGHTRDINPPHLDADIDGLLTPGLVNAHTHLELTHVPRPPTPGTFQDWLLTTMAAAPRDDSATATAVHDGVRQSLGFGVTLVGDISQRVGVARAVLAETPIRAISFGECLGLAERRERFNVLLRAAVTPAAGEQLRVGVSPHSPYTVEREDFRRAIRAAAKVGGHVTTHLAETIDESSFLDRHGGPFRELYRRLGIDPGPGSRNRSGVIMMAYHAGLLSHALLAHVNYVNDAELSLMSAFLNKSRVVWCPRTHAYFGHPPHRWRQMRACGIRVCIGTDSCASSPDLNVIDDLRLIRQQNPDLPADALWPLVTDEAADALRWGEGIGRLVVGAHADFAAWPTRTNDPLAEVLDTPGMLPSGVWIGGDLVSSSDIRSRDDGANSI